MPHRDYYLPERQLVSQNDSAIIQSPQVPRSRFIGSWTRKMTFDAGYIVPFMLDEILPGDSMRYNVTAYVRMATPLFPIFDNQRIDTFFFFVPNRILWANWARFMGEQASPSDSIAFTIPQIVSTPGGYAVGSIYDHFGLPTAGQIPGANTVSHSTLPLRAYNLIYQQWFKDQNIINAVVTDTTDGPDTLTWYTLRRRTKAHDYFTSALPWAQKFTAPNVPVAGLAPITGIGFAPTMTQTGGPVSMLETTGPAVNYAQFMETSIVGNVYVKSTATVPPNSRPEIYADLSQATGVAINTFRLAWAVQSMLERDARGGTRYTEKIRAHFGVVNPDFRLQRPEYIGGGNTPLQITPIAQTAPTAGVPLGALGATGTAAGQHVASYAATEHGWILGLINIRTELSYQQGLHKMWSRLTQHDHYFPEFAGLGEQAILRKEIYIVGDAAPSPLDNTVFGYQERWHEYRTRQSEITGIFRSTEVGTLDAWHFGQLFSSPPTLSQAFIEDETDNILDRNLAAGTSAKGQQYLADILINRIAVRPLPTFGTPAQLGRF